MNCVNCNYEFEDNYCPSCGQKGNVPRITFQSTLSSVTSAFTNMDRGLLYNFRFLTLSPKNTVLKYLQGQRKGIFNPIAYAILSITIYLIMESILKSWFTEYTFFSGQQSSEQYQLGKKAGSFLRYHIKYFWLLNIFYLTLFTKMFFGKYNFFEHITINAFLLGQATFMGILIFLVTRWALVFNPLIFLALIILLYFTFRTPGNGMSDVVLSVIAVFFAYLVFFMIPIGIFWLIS